MESLRTDRGRESAGEMNPKNWKGILVYLQTDVTGNLLPVSLELLGKAAELSQSSGEEVYGLIAVREMRDCYRRISGMEKLFVALGEGYGPFSNHMISEAVIECIKQCRPGVVLFGATGEGRSIAPSAAVYFRTGLTADCTELHMAGDGSLLQIRPAFGGNLMAEIITPDARPQMATVRPGIMASLCPALKQGYPVEFLEAPELVPVRGRVLGVEKRKAAQEASLENAEFIVAAGGGIRDKRELSRLRLWAQKNGAIFGCSRKLVERGWMQGERQIGLSGCSIAPKLLITVGISGSVQFLAGIQRAQYVAAIDSNGDAPIFDRANRGILADLKEVLNELEKGEDILEN